MFRFRFGGFGTSSAFGVSFEVRGDPACRAPFVSRGCDHPSFQIGNLGGSSFHFVQEATRERVRGGRFEVRGVSRPMDPWAQSSLFLLHLSSLSSGNFCPEDKGHGGNTGKLRQPLPKHTHYLNYGHTI